MKALFEIDVKFWDFTGGRVSFDIPLYTKILGHERTLVFVALCLITFFAADPSGHREVVPFWFDILIWPAAFSFYLILYQGLLLACAALTLWNNRLRFPLPLLGAIALLPTVFVCETAVLSASAGAYDRPIVPQLIFFFLAVQALETVFFKFILPNVRQEIDQTRGDRHLIVGGERFNLDKLLHIEAREHHVNLTFEDSQKLSRARLGDIVAQTRAEDGIQPHRSWWIARDGAIRPERRNGRLFLRLRDDTEVPVARTRIPDVENWLETHIDQYRQ